MICGRFDLAVPEYVQHSCMRLIFAVATNAPALVDTPVPEEKSSLPEPVFHEPDGSTPNNGTYLYSTWVCLVTKKFCKIF
jgi:hypothetical protein